MTNTKKPKPFDPKHQPRFPVRGKDEPSSKDFISQSAGETNDHYQGREYSKQDTKKVSGGENSN